MCVWFVCVWFCTWPKMKILNLWLLGIRFQLKPCQPENMCMEGLKDRDIQETLHGDVIYDL